MEGNGMATAANSAHDAACGRRDCARRLGGIENRKHNRLEVAPRVNGSIQLSREMASLSLQSNGFGPAVLHDFRIYLDGRVVHDARARNSVLSPWQQLKPLLNVEGYLVSGNAPAAGSRMRAGQDYDSFTISPRDTSSNREPEMANVLHRVGVQVCYCSIYDDQCRSVYVGTREVEGAREGIVDECARRDSD
jgi:hypothetical protein